MKIKTLLVISFFSFIFLPLQSYSDGVDLSRVPSYQDYAQQGANTAATELCLNGNMQACTVLQSFSGSSNTTQPNYGISRDVPTYQNQPTYQSEPTCPDYKRQRVETKNSVQYYDGCGRLERTVPKVGSGYNKVDDLDQLNLQPENLFD
jgi:hypothetical protein